MDAGEHRECLLVLQIGLTCPSSTCHAVLWSAFLHYSNVSMRMCRSRYNCRRLHLSWWGGREIRHPVWPESELVEIGLLGFHFGRNTSFDRDIIDYLLISGWWFMPLKCGISEILDRVPLQRKEDEPEVMGVEWRPW